MKPLLRVASKAFPEAAAGGLRAQRASFSFAGHKASEGGKLSTIMPGGSTEQCFPLGPYYESILKKPQPVPDVKPEQPPTTSPKSPRTTVKKPPPKKKPKDTPAAAATATATAPTVSPEPTPPPSSAEEKARVVFGSRLAGPIERAERLAALRKQSTRIAGVLVPPRPEEPDNCCMSGCVNCVWDRYRDEMEEWVAASAEAEKALQAQQQQQAPAPAPATPRSAPDVVSSAVAAPHQPPATGALSMDDDGGGSEANWQADLKKADRPKIAKDLWDNDLYKNVPVGIREFMKQEKRLKEKHAREGTFGA